MASERCGPATSGRPSTRCSPCSAPPRSACCCSRPSPARPPPPPRLPSRSASPSPVAAGASRAPLPRPYPSGAFLWGPVVVTMDDLVISGVVLALLAVLFLVFNVTAVGKVIQAVFQTQRGAALVGINVRAFHGVMWGAGAALGAVGGVLMALIVPLTPDIGVATLVRGFAAMTLGGFGSLQGAVIGGLLLGIMEKLLGFYVSTVFI